MMRPVETKQLRSSAPKVSKDVKKNREPLGNTERFTKLRNVHAQDQNPLSDEQKVLEGKAKQGT